MLKASPALPIRVGQLPASGTSGTQVILTGEPKPLGPLELPHTANAGAAPNAPNGAVIARAIFLTPNKNRPPKQNQLREECLPNTSPAVTASINTIIMATGKSKSVRFTLFYRLPFSASLSPKQNRPPSGVLIPKDSRLHHWLRLPRWCPNIKDRFPSLY